MARPALSIWVTSASEGLSTCRSGGVNTTCFGTGCSEAASAGCEVVDWTATGGAGTGTDAVEVAGVGIDVARGGIGIELCIALGGILAEGGFRVSSGGRAVLGWPIPVNVNLVGGGR